MTFDEIREVALSQEDLGPFKDYLLNSLGLLLWDIGALWDIIDDVDPHECRGEPPCIVGTPNHRSMTYKLRKIAGYSCP